jgi:hypothetical protein
MSDNSKKIIDFSNLLDYNLTTKDINNFCNYLDNNHPIENIYKYNTWTINRILWCYYFSGCKEFQENKYIDIRPIELEFMQYYFINKKCNNDKILYVLNNNKLWVKNFNLKFKKKFIEFILDKIDDSNFLELLNTQISKNTDNDYKFIIILFSYRYELIKNNKEKFKDNVLFDLIMNNIYANKIFVKNTLQHILIPEICDVVCDYVSI